MLSASGIFILNFFRLLVITIGVAFLFMDAINDDYTQTRAESDGQVFISLFCYSGGLAYSYGAVDSL